MGYREDGTAKLSNLLDVAYLVTVKLLLLLLLLSGATPAAFQQPAAPVSHALAPKAEVIPKSEPINQKVIGQPAIPVELTVKIKPDNSSLSIADKHPNAVYFILIAAGLAALASIISSIINAVSSWRLKNREYKNEYHKKVIDKRLKAIEHAEQLLITLNPIKIRANGDRYHSWFLEDNWYNEYRKLFLNITLYGLWFSKDTAYALREFNAAMYSVNQSTKPLDDVEKKKVILCDRYKELTAKAKEISASVTKDLMIMDDVEGFFNARSTQQEDSSKKKLAS